MISRYEMELKCREGSADPLDTAPHWTWDNPLNVLALMIIVILALGFLA